MMMFTSCICTPCTSVGAMVYDPRCPVHGVTPLTLTVVPGFVAAGTQYAHDTAHVNEKTHAEGRTLLRVAKELRAFLADAPVDDPEAQSLRRDCDTLERVGHWLASTNAVTFAAGVSVAGECPTGAA